MSGDSEHFTKMVMIDLSERVETRRTPRQTSMYVSTKLHICTYTYLHRCMCTYLWEGRELGNSCKITLVI